MPFAAKPLAGPTNLTGTAATVYTVPGSTTTVVKSVTAANVTGADRKIFVSIGTDAVGTRVLPGVVVPANDVLVLDVWWPMTAAQIMQAYTDTSGGITLFVGGIEQT